jgi:hypothetical protein
MLDEGWFQRGDARRSLDVTTLGIERLRTHFDIDSRAVEAFSR